MVQYLEPRPQTASSDKERRYLLKAFAFQVLALNLVVQVVDIRPVVLAPMNLECALQRR